MRCVVDGTSNVKERIGEERCIYWGFALHDWDGRHLVPESLAIGVDDSSTYQRSWVVQWLARHVTRRHRETLVRSPVWPLVPSKFINVSWRRGDINIIAECIAR